MPQRGRFHIAMIERLGAPLLAAAAEQAGPDASPAALMARALNGAVQLGIGFAQGIDLRGDPDDADQARLALTSVSAILIADHLRRTGKPPEEAELRAWVQAAQAVLVFADAFAPDGVGTARLDNLQPAFDETQSLMLYLQALAPPVAAIAAFSFGRQDRKLAQDVAERLTQRARAMGAALSQDDPVSLLMLLGALGKIYAGCHRAEADRLAGLDEKARAAMTGSDGQVSLDPLWAKVETQIAMLETLGLAFTGQASGGGNSVPAPMAQTPALPDPPPMAPPPPKPSSPMGFFKPGAKPPPPENGDGV